MALNPNIPLAGRVPQVSLANALMQGIQAREAISNAPILAQLNRERLNQSRQNTQLGTQNMQLNEQTLAQNQQAQDARQALLGNQIARQLLNFDSVDQRRRVLDVMKTNPAYADLDLDEEDDRFLTNDGLNEVLAATQPVVEASAPRQATVQFGSSQVGKDSEGNSYNITTVRDPSSGSVRTVYSPIGNSPEAPIGQVELVGSTGMTASERTGQATEQAGSVAAVESAVRAGEDAFEQLSNVRATIANYDDALKALDEGAASGAFQSRLPSFRTASVALDNAQARLGLNVIQNTTFGALSKGELDLALNVGLPDNMPEDDLRQWILNKKEAQQKLEDYISQAAAFLSSGRNTITDWIEYQQNLAPTRAQQEPQFGISQEDIQAELERRRSNGR